MTAPLAVPVAPPRDPVGLACEIASAEAPERIAAEVAALGPARALASLGPCTAYCATAAEIPAALREIGRLRELSFRAVGEGTGRARDLDDFDGWYEHLFVWNAEQRVIAGAYRVGRIDEILAAHGPDGLYTRTLFLYSDALLARVATGLELGRSFVRAENQRVSLVLLLLWRGIAQLLARAPRHRCLLGPVSIDRRYQASSLGLMVGYLSARHGVLDAGARPLRPYAPADLRDAGWLAQGAGLADVDALSKAVSALEPDGRGVPVLVRQYLRLGAEVLGFNVDPAFSDVVDALMLLDLDRMDDRRRTWFMGEPEAR